MAFGTGQVARILRGDGAVRNLHLGAAGASRRPNFVVTETDNETIVGEEGLEDSLTVVLTVQPDSAVTIDVASSETSEVAVEPARLIFTAGNWNHPQTVTGVNDLILDGSQLATITIRVDIQRSAEAFRTLASQLVRVTTTDNEVGSSSVAETDGATIVSEARSTDTIRVVLDARPLASVTIGASSSDASEATAFPASMTFTPDNWNVRQVVEVTGVDDSVVDGDQTFVINLSINKAASDPAFHSAGDANVTVTTRDNDSLRMNVLQTDGNTIVSEDGSSDSVSITLSNQPTSEVLVRIVSHGTAEVETDPSWLAFTPADWNQPQRIAVRGLDDHQVDGSQLTVITISVEDWHSAAAFVGLEDHTIEVITLDDDEAGLVVTHTDNETIISENGSTDEFTVSLTTRPTSLVTIDVLSSDVGEIIASPPRLRFTMDNWNIPQRVTVVGVDDFAIDGDQLSVITLSASPGQSDAAYRDVSRSVTGISTDNDIPGISIDSNQIAVSEAGTSGLLRIKLTAQPESSVTIVVAVDDRTEVAVSSILLTFQPDDWHLPQTLAVTGVDDNVVDGDSVTSVRLTVSKSMSDEHFHSVAERRIDVTVLDDDKLPTAIEGAIVTSTSLTLTHSGQVLDIADLAALGMTELSRVDIRGVGDNTPRLDANMIADIASTTRTLLVHADKGDTVEIGSGWRLHATETQDGEFVRVLKQAGATLRMIGPDDWSNPANSLDVNGNGTVEPLDALQIIHELNTPRFNASGRLRDAAEVSDFPNSFYDVSADGFVSPQDVLIVVNYLNRLAGTAAEGEEAIPAYLNEDSTNAEQTPQAVNRKNLQPGAASSSDNIDVYRLVDSHQLIAGPIANHESLRIDATKGSTREAIDAFLADEEWFDRIFSPTSEHVHLVAGICSYSVRQARSSSIDTIRLHRRAVALS